LKLLGTRDAAAARELHVDPQRQSPLAGHVCTGANGGVLLPRVSPYTLEPRRLSAKRAVYRAFEEADARIDLVHESGVRPKTI
jgi:hypothetical protein